MTLTLDPQILVQHSTFDTSTDRLAYLHLPMKDQLSINWIEMITKTWISLLGLAVMAIAIPELPQQTESPSLTQSPSPYPATTPLTTITTSKPQSLQCTNGSTVRTTTDCTVGRTYSFCYSQPPPLACPPSSYPSSYDCGECDTCTSCFSVSAPYLTTTCDPHNGEFPYSTVTIYNGTLAGGTSTTILRK